MLRSISPAVRYFLCGQAIFYLLLGFQVAIRPAGLTANHGVCYYALFANTAPLYVLGLALAGLLHLAAIRHLPRDYPLSLGVVRAFKGMGVCLAGLLAVPIAHGKWLGFVHVFFGSGLFLIQLALAVRLAGFLRNPLSYSLIVLQLLAGLVCIFSLLHGLRYQLEGQVVFQLCFALIMLRYLCFQAAVDLTRL